MKDVQELAAEVAANRKPVAEDNPYLAVQKQVSDQIIAALDAYRAAHDQWVEQTFWSFYGSPVVQGMLGLNACGAARTLPRATPEELTARKARADAYAAMLRTGGFDEALVRAALFVVAAGRVIDERSALAMNVARQRLMRLSLGEFKTLVRDQFFVLHLERERAVEALAFLVPDGDARKELLKTVKMIIEASGSSLPAERDRLARLAQVLAGPIEKPVAPADTSMRKESRLRAPTSEFTLQKGPQWRVFANSAAVSKLQFSTFSEPNSR